MGVGLTRRKGDFRGQHRLQGPWTLTGLTLEVAGLVESWQSLASQGPPRAQPDIPPRGLQPGLRLL